MVYHRLKLQQLINENRQDKAQKLKGSFWGSNKLEDLFPYV